VLAAGVLGCGVVALAGGIVVLAYIRAQLTSTDHLVWLSGGPAAVSAMLAGAGVPAGIVAQVLGVNARRIKAGGLAGRRMVAVGRVSGAAGLALYVVALGIAVVSMVVALYHYG
jgi:hypothetical protein